MKRGIWKAALGVGVIVLATLSATGPSTARTPDVFQRLAVSRHTLSTQAAATEVRELWGTRAQWAGEYADDINFIHPGQGEFVVLVKEHVNEVYDRIPAAVRPYVKVARGGVAKLAGSPSSDRGGWTGGNDIRSTNAQGDQAHCTEGFAWKSWATGAILGSTALHCYTYTSPFINWYNDGRLVGTRTQAGTANNDVLLLRPAPGTSFNASIWVRTSTGGFVERTVTSAEPNKVGQVVAFYGTTSGGGSGTILATDYQGRAGEVWTNTTQARKGDSGGPVFRTHGDGTVDARGTLSSGTCLDTNQNGIICDVGDTGTGMLFIDAAYTSANLGVSIYTP